MGALKPRTGSGPLEAEREDRGFVIRIPAAEGESLVVTLDRQEARDLARLLLEVD